MKHIHTTIQTHTQTYTCSSFPSTPSGKISLVFIIWFQICVSAFTVHMGEENEQQLLLFAAFCLSTSLAFHQIFALSQCWWDWRNRPILILSGSCSALPLYLPVCSVQGRARTLFPQRIRHAECWRPLHTKRLGIRRKRSQCGLRDSDQIPNLNRKSKRTNRRRLLLMTVHWLHIAGGDNPGSVGVIKDRWFTVYWKVHEISQPFILI